MKKLITSILFVGLFSAHASYSDPAVDGFVLERVEISGNTVFSDGQLAAALPAAAGDRVFIEDLLAMADAITALYQEAGYITSGAMLPAQDIAGGVVRIEVKEGTLGAVNLLTDGRLSLGYLKTQVAQMTQGPVRLSDLQRVISRLEQEAVISHVRGELKPGANQGDAVLDLSVVEADAFSVVVGANNYKSPSVGEGQGEISFQHLNLLGRNDQFSFGYQDTDGVDAMSIRYDAPILFLRSRLAVFAAKGDTLVVEEPFDEIALESETDTLGLQFNTTWRDTGRSRLASILSYEKKESRTSLLGLPFDFSPGSRNGLTEASILGFGFEWSRRGEKSGTAIRVTGRSGTDENDVPGVDGDFSLYRIQAQYAHRFDNAWQLRFGLNMQETSDTLPAFERMALGGHDTVRGYRENRLLKDSALLANVGLILNLSSADEGGVGVSAELFADYGRGENSEPALNVDTKGSLSSVGLALTAQYGGLTFELVKAHRFDDKEALGDTFQDEGIHVGVTYEF